MKMFYYYTRWTLPGDDWVKKGVYHATWISPENTYDFCQSCGKNTIFIRQFETLQEMEAFAQTVGLKEPPVEQTTFQFC